MCVTPYVYPAAGESLLRACFKPHRMLAHACESALLRRSANCCARATDGWSASGDRRSEQVSKKRLPPSRPILRQPALRPRHAALNQETPAALAVPMSAAKPADAGPPSEERGLANFVDGALERPAVPRTARCEASLHSTLTPPVAQPW